MIRRNKYGPLRISLTVQIQGIYLFLHFAKVNLVCLRSIFKATRVYSRNVRGPALCSSQFYSARGPPFSGQPQNRTPFSPRVEAF